MLPFEIGPAPELGIPAVEWQRNQVSQFMTDHFILGLDPTNLTSSDKENIYTLQTALSTMHTEAIRFEMIEQTLPGIAHRNNSMESIISARNMEDELFRIEMNEKSLLSVISRNPLIDTLAVRNNVNGALPDSAYTNAEGKELQGILYLLSLKKVESHAQTRMIARLAADIALPMSMGDARRIEIQEKLRLFSYHLPPDERWTVSYAVERGFLRQLKQNMNGVGNDDHTRYREMETQPITEQDAHDIRAIMGYCEQLRKVSPERAQLPQTNIIYTFGPSKRVERKGRIEYDAQAWIKKRSVSRAWRIFEKIIASPLVHPKKGHLRVYPEEVAMFGEYGDILDHTLGQRYKLLVSVPNIGLVSSRLLNAFIRAEHLNSRVIMGILPAKLNENLEKSVFLIKPIYRNLNPLKPIIKKRQNMGGLKRVDGQSLDTATFFLYND
jgi:hypothetical protein